MFLDPIIIVLGFVGLVWGADKFVFGTSVLARHFGVSPLMIGLTIVAFGTSAPEIFSSAVSALNDKPELAVGNALGSNLFNIGVALGVAAMKVFVQHPIQDRTDEEMAAIADLAFEHVMAMVVEVK